MSLHEAREQLIQRAGVATNRPETGRAFEGVLALAFRIGRQQRTEQARRASGSGRSSPVMALFAHEELDEVAAPHLVIGWAEATLGKMDIQGNG